MHLFQPPLSSSIFPRTLWVGVGFKQGSSGELLQWAVRQALARYGLEIQAIAGFATLDHKALDPELRKLVTLWNLPLLAIPSETLAQVPVSQPSFIVAQSVGTPSVAEASAMVAALTSQGNTLLSFSGTLPKLFPKQVYRSPHLSGAVTIAIAEVLHS